MKNKCVALYISPADLFLYAFCDYIKTFQNPLNIQVKSGH